MEIREILVTQKFARQYEKLPEKIRYEARAREAVFRGNVFDPRLATHKLHGKEKEAWAFSITRAYRIKFIFLKEQSVLFLEIGTHDIYI